LPPLLLDVHPAAPTATIDITAKSQTRHKAE
jgi:hypothetical protein